MVEASFALLTVFAAILALAAFKLARYAIGESAELKNRVEELEKKLGINNEKEE